MAEVRFWEHKTLAQMDDQEWESLCDGCARCCLNRLEDDDGDMHVTNVACFLLDHHSCRCGNYPARQLLVPDCLSLTADTVDSLDWLPGSCAYRRLAEGKPLQWWHPLVSGSRHTVHQAGISVRNKVVNEQDIHPSQLEHHIVEWFD